MQLVVCQIVLTYPYLLVRLVTYPYLLDYPYKMIAVGLSKQQTLDADSRAIQRINFIANLDRAGNTTMFSITE